MHIRQATEQDRGDIYNLHHAAFNKSERETVCELAVSLLAERSRPAVVSLVAEFDGMVLGHIAFSPVSFQGSEHGHAYILSPLAVLPQYQKQGVGSKLIKFGMQQLSEDTVSILLVYGDPRYYGSFGFNAHTAQNFVPPFKLQYPFGWQAIALNDRVVVNSPVKISCVAALQNPELW